MARGGRSSAPGGVRQRKHWHGTSDNVLNLTAAGTAILASLTVTDPSTILRTLGSVMSIFDGAVDGDSAAITYGLGIVSTDAFTVGATAMPDPASEPQFDWLYWYKSFLSFRTNGAISGRIDSYFERVNVSSKAMRRVSHSETLVLLVQYEDIVGTPPVDVLGSLRILIGE